MLCQVFYGFCLVFFLSALFFLIYIIFSHAICCKEKQGIFLCVYTEDFSRLPCKVYSACVLGKFAPLGKRKVYVIDNGIPSYIKELCRQTLGDMGRVIFIKEAPADSIYKISDNKH